MLPLGGLSSAHPRVARDGLGETVTEVPDRPSAELPDLGILAALAPQLAKTFVSIASDIALVVDDQGVIRNVAVGPDAIGHDTHDWVGRRWADTVTGDTQRKVQQLLDEAQSGAVARRREINHRTEAGQEIPVAYAAVRLGRDGPVLAVGRDLRAVSAIQQRFIDAQQAMERDYWRQRQAETRYRMLFQVATDGVLVVDAHQLQIVEANRAAARMFHRSPENLVGEHATSCIAPVARAAVEELLITARTTGRPGEIRALVGAEAGHAPLPVDISATPFRAEATLLLLVRVRSAEAMAERHGSGSRLADFVERLPDAVVITDSAGRVLMANPAFSALCAELGGGHASVAPLIVGRRLGELLGDETQQLAAVMADARRVGIADQRPVAVAGPGGARLEVELSAALLAEGDQECLGMTLRRLYHRPAPVPLQVGELASAIDRLAAQVGVVSLPELLQETCDLAERHLIEAALARTDGQRPRAAALLGIGQEQLQQRMQHHGLPDGPGTGPQPGLLN